MTSNYVTFGLAALGTASVWSAIPTGVGPYTLSERYPGTATITEDLRVGSPLEGDQTWIVDTDRNFNPFWPGTKSDDIYWQIFTGKKITALSGSEFRVMRGNVVFENAVVSQTSGNLLGHVAATQVKFRKGGSLLATANHIRIGGAYNNVPYPATVWMEEPSSLSAAGYIVIVGNEGTGALWMDGGTLSLTNNQLTIGSSSANGQGYMRLNGGTVSLRAENSSAFGVGHSATYSSFHQSGGTLMSRLGVYSGELHAYTCNEKGKNADIYLSGGVFDLHQHRFGLGCWASDTKGSRTSFTVDGDAEAALSLLAMGRNGVGNQTALNLNGGVFSLQVGCANYGNKVNNRWYNFNGGTLKLRSGADFGDSYCGQIVVYPEGGTIEVEANKTSPFNSLIRSAQGFGVSEITLTNPGSGYYAAPEVTITGGSGSNATAYAVMKADRTIEKIVVTCRGEGYRPNDTVTVTIAAKVGTGATATATLSENTPGVLVKKGAGIWTQRVDSPAFTGTVRIEEGSLVFVNGAAFGNATVELAGGYLRQPNDASIATNTTLGTLTLKPGVSTVIVPKAAEDAVGLTVETFSREPGGVALLTAPYADQALAIGSTVYASGPADRQILNGLAYDAGSGDGDLLVLNSEGRVSPAGKTSTLSEDAVFAPGNGTFNCSKVGGIVLDYHEAYLSNAEPIEIQSGMIYRPSSSVGVVRCGATGGGALTTRNPGGMVVFERSARARSNSQYPTVAESPFFDKDGSRRLIVGPFCDPDASTPMTVTFGGFQQSRPSFGALAWLLNASSYSGGTILVNGGVIIVSDACLGAATAPITVIGSSMIGMRENTLNLSAKRTLDLRKDSVLLLSPVLGNSGNTVASKLTGSGDLITADVGRGNYAVAFTGDHSTFAGDYYIIGNARIAPSVFSAQAGICLADASNGVGVVETAGAFTRSAGNGKGEVCWKAHPSRPVSYGLKGGFAALGGDLTVNLGGAGAALEVGSEYLPDEAIIRLQSQYANGALTFANGFALAGKTQRIEVAANKTATLTGTVADAVGGGQLAVKGDITFGGTLSEGEETVAAAKPLLSVEGNLTAAHATIDLSGVSDAVLTPFRKAGLVVATATGSIAGTFNLNAPALWKVGIKEGNVVAKYTSGTMVIVR